MNSSSDGERQRTAVFAMVGEFWTIGFVGETFSLKTSKGLTYIERLLQHPGDEFHALDLVNGPGSYVPDEGDAESSATDTNLSVGRLGDSGEMLDAKAKQEYKHRLVELKEELDEAKLRGKVERAAEIESEIDFLAHEISRAIGLGGRDRRAGSAAERARLNVTRAIKSAIDKIGEFSAELSELLDKSIHTGSFCSFTDDRQNPVEWRFALEDAAPVIAPAETAPVLSAPQSAMLQLEERTRFVGRADELSVLRGCLEQAAAGRGSIVVISGPPGIGKTRIAHELCKDAVKLGFFALLGACYDRADTVPFSPFVEILEAASRLWSKPADFRSVLGDSAPELARLMPALRRMFPDLPPAASDLAPEQSRRMLFNAFVDFISRMRAPLLLLIDDLQWADEGSLSLLNHAALSAARLPLLIVGTCRDNEIEHTGELGAVLQACVRLHVLEQMNLGSLPQSATAEMIGALSGRQPPQPVVDAIYTASEGNPFFIEELFHHLVERRKLFDEAGEFRNDLNSGDIDVPQSIRLVIGRRLARLHEDTHKVLDAAAVVGRSFTFRLMEAATGIDADRLLNAIEEAESAGLISSTVERPDALFHFSHELIRQVVLRELSIPRRQRLHLRIADAIESIHAGAAADRANDLAYHLWQAGAAADPVKTIEYLAIAARRARAQSAFETALTNLRYALERVPALEPGPARDKQELDLYIEYLSVVGLTNRWTTSEAGAIYDRARELCERSGETSRMCRLLQGSAVFHLGRAEFVRTEEYGRRVLELSANSPEWEASANYILGFARFCLGDLISARKHLEYVIALRDKLPPGARGKHTKIFTQCVHGMVLWMLGYPDQASAAADDAVSLAQAIDDPYALAFAYTHAHVVAMYRRDYARALELADTGLKIASDKRFEWLQTSLSWSREACRVLHGAESRIDRVRSAFESYFASEAKLYRPRNCTVFAECCGVLGQPELGMPMLDEAVAAIAENGHREAEAEMWRIKGTLLLSLANLRSADDAQACRREAEACIRKAIQIAREQQTKLWELRATVSLARIMDSSGRTPEAVLSLSTIYRWFNEGFDSPDLKEAKELLSELRTRG